MEVIKKPYEISLWEDELRWVRRKLVNKESEDEYRPGKFYSFRESENQYRLDYDEENTGKTYYKLSDLDEEGANWIEGNKAEDIEANWTDPNVIITYFKEVRICTIGSNTMISLSRCLNPKLVSKVNGENIFTFSMYYQYIDNETGEKVYNPFVPYLVNERKIKLKLENKWYDLVVKQVQEDSASKMFNYTCKDQFINELSKSGFELVLDNELENNMGTVEELGKTVLEGSDWAVESGDALKQYIEEPLYEIILASEIVAKNIEDQNNSVTIAAGKKIYVFYSVINEKKSDFQFLYSTSPYEVDDDLVVKKETTNYIIEGVEYKDELPTFASTSTLSNWRGMRLVRQAQTKYDSTIDKYVSVYEKDNDSNTYYGFTESEYVSPTSVRNLLANSGAFSSTDGWYDATSSRELNFSIASTPDITEDSITTENLDFHSYLKIKKPGESNENIKVLNRGIESNRAVLTGFSVGDELILKLKYKLSKNGQYETVAPTVLISKYTIDGEKYVEGDNVFEFVNFDGPYARDPKDNWNYIYLKGKCVLDVSEAKLEAWNSRFGVFFDFGDATEIYLEDAQLYSYVEYKKKDKTVISNEDIIVSDVEGNLLKLAAYGKTSQETVPTPENPVSLVDVEGDITIIGNNLFDLNTVKKKYTIDENGNEAANTNYMASDYIPVKGGMAYTSSEKQTYALSSGSQSTSRCACYDKSKNFISILYAESRTEVKTYTRTFTVPENARYIRFGHRITDEDIIVNVGLKKLPYETHSSIAFMNCVLRGVPVSSGGNYTDIKGQQWICDEVNCAKGIFNKAIETIEFTGNEEWTTFTDYPHLFTCNISKAGQLNRSPVLCSHFPYDAGGLMEGKDGCRFAVGSVAKEIYKVYISSSIHTNTEDFKVWLAQQKAAGNPVKMVYALYTPIETPLSAEQLATFSALRTNTLHTTILNNAGADMAITYESSSAEDVSYTASPGDALFSEIKTKYIYYQPNSTWTSIKDLVPSNVSYEPLPVYKPHYTGSEFTKVRSITAKESNRFNLIQSLCETFECWARFNVERDEESGTIKYGKDKGKFDGDEAYRQQKFVSFRETTGDYNWAGFRYGINSKQIQRTLDSAQIVSKMIVKDNANEFAPGGFCSVARANENPTKENFLLNFDYYVHQGLLNLSDITNDLYLDIGGYLGYYKNLKRINTDRENIIGLQENLRVDISNYESSYQAYKNSFDSAFEEQQNIEQQVKDYVKSDKSFEEITADPDIISKYKNEETFISLTRKWTQLESVKQQHKPLYEKAQVNLAEAQNQFNSIETQIKNMAEAKRQLNLQFYKKYSRFIQEGSWIKEDYVDDNLYYIDADAVLRTSAKPKTTYSFNVLDIGLLTGYEDYKFNLGDRTYIEDIEFFGWSLLNRMKPYQQEIIVSELSQNLDSPENDQIKVQNYKTQFEDLFTRVTAATQQVEYHTGEYARATNVIQQDGTISAESLQNSFAANALRLENAKDQSVVIDEYGVTTTSLAKPNEMVRIVSGGIFMSTDGGQSWKTGITGHGLNSTYMTAGQINTEKMYIMNSGIPAFRWDSKGISAYWNDDNTYDVNKFVRFDQFGIYGLENADKIEINGIGDIRENARFSLTWDGFSLKNKYGNGYVSIDSVNDFVVNDGDKNRIKIGNLAAQGESPIYGIRISDEQGATVMETSDKGELWLRDKLHIGTANSSHIVQIGRLENQAVINANNNFIVYEDGSVAALNGRFDGQINATSGSFTGEINANSGSLGGGAVQLSSSGIVIKGSQLAIQNNNEENVLSADENGNLTITGTINATAGSFSGDLYAKSGNIGGFVIQENQLISTEDDHPSITLNGQEGIIKADKIELGIGATITDYLAIGDRVKIYGNPATHNNSFISVENDEGEILSLKQDGKLTAGTITIDGNSSKIFAGTSGNQVIVNGEDGSIQTENFSVGSSYGWRISQRDSTFNNVVVRGAIQASVFEYGVVQAVGGILLVRPSAKVKSVIVNNDKTIVVSIEDLTGFNVNDYCLFSTGMSQDGKSSDKIYYKISEVDEDKALLTLIPVLGEITEDYTGPIVDMGQDESVGIIINSSNNKSFGAPQSISVIEFQPKEKSNTYDWVNPIILGKLPEEEKFGDMKGHYGLYAENVFLRGSLVTQMVTENGISGVYCGISTVNKDSAPPISNELYFGPEKTGEILLWAGAESMDKTGIEGSKFYVDRRGNVYANSGYFEGTIITKSTITASEIKTVTITGIGDKDNEEKEIPALTITDTTHGISFVSGGSSIFDLKNDKITAFGDNLEITSVYTQASSIRSYNPDNGLLELKNNNLSYMKQKDGSINSQLNFGEESLSLSIGELKDAKKVVIESKKTSISNTLNAKGIVEYGEGEKITYRPVYSGEELIGYDLYVG